MICIEKAPVLKAFDALQDQLYAAKVPMKRRIVIMDVLRNAVNSLPEYDPDYVDPDTYKAPKTEMVEELVPLVPYGKICNTGFFCRNCKARVKKKDKFCRSCGFEFTKEDADDGEGADSKAAVQAVS